MAYVPPKLECSHISQYGRLTGEIEARCALASPETGVVYVLSRLSPAQTELVEEGLTASTSATHHAEVNESICLKSS